MHQLVLLGGAAVVALGLAMVLSSQGGGSSRAAKGVGDALVPGLEKALNAVDRISIAREEQTLTLTRDASGWSVQEADGYSASVGRVRELLLSLSDAELLEAKTSNPENYETLGLQPPAAGGTAIALGASEGNFDDTSIAIGNTARQGTATYVRRDDEQATWLASGSLSASTDLTSWVDPQIIDVPSARVQAVTIEHDDGETVTVSKAARDATSFDLADIPEGKELRFANAANPIAGALGSLRMEGVKAAASMAVPADATTTRFATFDGLVITARAFEVEGTAHLALEAAYDAQQAARFAPATSESDTGAASSPPESNGEAVESPVDDEAPADDAADDNMGSGDDADVGAEAEALQRALSPWVYQIGGFKFDQLTRRMDDLVQDPPPLPDAALPDPGAGS